MSQVRAHTLCSSANTNEERLSELDILLLHEVFLEHWLRKNEQDIQRARTENKKEEQAEMKLDNKQKKQRDFAKLLVYGDLHDEAAYYEQSTSNCTVTNTCTHKCLLFQPSIAKNVFICISRGAIHHCTAASCDSLCVTHESRYCLITGLSYSLECSTEITRKNEEGERVAVVLAKDTFTTVNDFDGAGNAKRKRKSSALLTSTPVNQMMIAEQPQQTNHLLITDGSQPLPSANENMLDDILQEMQQQQQQDVYNNSTALVVAGTTNTQTQMVVKGKVVRAKHPKRLTSTELTVLKQTKKRSDVPSVKTNNKEQLISIARNLLQQLIPSLCQSECHRIATECMVLWVKVIETKYYKEIKGKYRYLTHVAAVLYNALDGIHMKGKYLLKPEPDLYKRLPPSKILKNFGIKVNNYTKCSRFLHEMTRELLL